MRLVGREPELALVRAFASNLADDPGVLVVDGAAGMGKTALLRTVLDDAGEAGVRVLHAAPSEAESALAFAVLSDLVRDLVPVWGNALPPPQRRAIEIALLLTDPGDEPLAPQAVGLGTLGLLRALAEDAPLLVAIDDDQWTDAPSARSLVYAARRLGAAAVGFCTARRPQTAGGLGPDLVAALGPDGSRSLTLVPLSAGAVRELIEERLGISLSRPLLRRLYDASGGNPLHALEVSRAIGGQLPALAADKPLPVPETLEELVASRVGALPHPTQVALEVAALAITPTLDLLTAAGVPDSAAALWPAVQAELVTVAGTSIGFGHPLYAAAIGLRLPVGRRREVHRMLAGAVATNEDRARHLALAAIGPSETAAAALELAASQAAARGASDIAAELLETSIRVTRPADEAALARRLLAASAACHKTAELVRARAHAHAALTLLPAGTERAEALLRLAASSVIDALPACEEALLEAGEDAGLRARISAYLCDRSLLVDFNAALGHARAGVADAGTAQDDARLAELLGMLGFAEAALGDPAAREHLGEAVRIEGRLGGLPAEFSPTMNLAIESMWRDDLDAARSGYRRILQRAHDEGDEHGVVFVLLHLAQTEWRSGRLGHADALLDEAVTAWTAAGEQQVLGIMLWLRSVIAGHRGRSEEARLAALEALDRNLDDRLFGARQHAALGFVELQTGESEAAVEQFRLARALLARLGIREPGVVLLAGDEIEALVAAGSVEAAAALVTDVGRMAQELDRPRLESIAARGRGLVLAAQGDLAGAIDAFAPAAAAPLAGLDQARALLALGATQRLALERGAARQSLERALDLFQTAGAAGFARRARDELGRIGGRPPALEAGLTPSEAGIAELVATGLSNKEVAARLFLSPRTVEGALTRIYSKLGLRSRAELAHRFSAAPD